MFRGNIIYGKDINIYLDGSPYHYYMYNNINQKHSFLIPRTHFELFIKDLEKFVIEVYFKIENNGDIKWFKLPCSYTLYESVYRYENYFEFNLNGTRIQMDESDIRNLKIKTILNEI
jgi:hypothetical protein